ncbi:hypothetical protein GCM10022403_096800 [Streptomyces coacervatus]|uniref:Uncharacterized protein n=1 Tax=Streptomyces coacervatus TaxID=647381 RepID=A0ABP7JQV0_9ACTN|nr:hypothetical protein [Streptomyces coacervatus]MDF2264066.1 hypothetical protein [Streptomyces coacervatus]
MTTNNFSGPTFGNFGDNGTFHMNAPVNAPAAQSSDPVALAAELIRQLRAEQPELAPQAEQVHRELVRAGEHNRQADQGRIRGWLETIQAGSTTTSGVLALVLSLGRAVGLPM